MSKLMSKENTRLIDDWLRLKERRNDRKIEQPNGFVNNQINEIVNEKWSHV